MSSDFDINVIIPNYNYARYLNKCLTSLINQTVKPNLITFIDDASTDDSIRIVKKFQNKIKNLRIIKNKRRIGVYLNLNKIIKTNKNKYLYFMSSDDYISNNFFEYAYNKLKNNNDIFFFSAESQYFNSENKNINNEVSNFKGKIKGTSFINFFKNYELNYQTNGIIFKKECFEEFLFPNCGPMSDSAFVFLIALIKGGYFTNKKLVFFRLHEKNYSSDIDLKAEEKIEEINNWLTINTPTQFRKYTKYWIRKARVNAKIRLINNKIKNGKISLFLRIGYRLERFFFSLCTSPKYVLKLLIKKLKNVLTLSIYV